VSGRNPNQPCARCGNEPRVLGYSYGAVCRRTMQRERYQRLAAQRRREAQLPKALRDACNCGNQKCNGMQCERASA